MLRFTVAELDRRDLAQVWPLVRTASSHLRLEEWERHWQKLVDRGGGAIGVAGEAGGFLGVATYEAVTKPRAGRVLKVDTLVTFELTRRPRIRQILCDELDELAPRLGCEALAVSAPKPAIRAAPAL